MCSARRIARRAAGRVIAERSGPPASRPATTVLSMERLVIVGGDAAGMSAASQARKRRGPDDLEIVAFERGRNTSYSACGIPYWIGEDVEKKADLITRTPEEFRNKQDIDVRIRSDVESLDLER